MKHLIINKPEWQTRRQRLLFRSLTTFFWVIWVYFWLPLLTLAGWYLGFKINYREMVVHGGYAGLAHLLKIYAAAAGGLGGALLVWAYYNYFRFRGIERRKHCRPVTVAELAAYYQISPEALGRWRQARRVVVHHDPQGQIVWAETSDYGQSVTLSAGPAVSSRP